MAIFFTVLLEELVIIAKMGRFIQIVARFPMEIRLVLEMLLELP
jgi:hypothetical protein